MIKNGAETQKEAGERPKKTAHLHWVEGISNRMHDGNKNGGRTNTLWPKKDVF